MTIPKNVSVLGTSYTVKIVNGVIMQGEEVCGYCDTQAKHIIINRRLHPKRKELVSTFLHELGHAIFAESSLNQTNIHTDVQEIIVDVFGRVIAELV